MAVGVKPKWPLPIGKEAYHGPAGELVNAIGPHSESDPVALLSQILTEAGNVISKNAHFRVEADYHSFNLFMVLVGETAKGRKGTSTGYMNLFRRIDLDWYEQCITTGLSSGEGLIWAVRNEILKHEPIRENGHITGYQEVVVDPGVEDKRLMVLEPEFSKTLRVMARDGNTLSPTIRQAWDSGDLRTMTKNSPAKATGAHISIIGHTTRWDLKRYLDQSDMANGFANRFLWLCVKRSKILPHGGRLRERDLEPILGKLKQAVEFGKTAGEIKRDRPAGKLWEEVYPMLSQGKPGLFGAVISRAEAQVMRLACIYAVLDKTNRIRPEHLRAAMAVWKYSEDSARYIFGDSTGNTLADRILEGLRNSPEGLTRTEMNDLFGRNVVSEKIDAALYFLRDQTLISLSRKGTGGRPVERWKLDDGEYEENEK